MTHPFLEWQVGGLQSPSPPKSATVCVSDVLSVGDGGSFPMHWEILLFSFFIIMTLAINITDERVTYNCNELLFLKVMSNK